MLYRVDFNLNPGKRINIFRQKLVNNSDTVANISLTNITVSELIREIRWLQKNSYLLTSQGILDNTGNNGLVDFEVYENLKGAGCRRHFITNDYEDEINQLPKLIDSKVQNRNSPYFIDKDLDPRHLLRGKKGVRADEVKNFSDAIVGQATLGQTTLGFMVSTNSLHEEILLKEG